MFSVIRMIFFLNHTGDLGYLWNSLEGLTHKIYSATVLLFIVNYYYYYYYLFIIYYIASENHFLQDGSKMAPSMAAVLRAPRKLCSFSYVLFVILLFYMLDVVSITVYDRHTLLNIGSFVAQRKPDFEFLNAGALFTNTASEPFVWAARPRPRKCCRKRRKRAGVLVRLRRRPLRPPLPTILLANVQSLDNKLCELREHISYQWETRDCCIICLTETWMSAVVPDSAIELTGFSVHRSDRTKELTGKSRGGGICFFINNSWCDERNLHSIKSFCSPDLEFHMLLCRPFWLPREFTAIIITAVYIPPQANTDQALKELYGNISEQETVYPDAAFIVTGDFNKANFRTIAPKYFQHITINTRGDRVLDHCYSPFRDAYKSLPRPPFGKSDHSSVLLLPAYRQKLKREAPALRTIQWVGSIGRYTAGLFWSRGLGHVPGSVWWRHRGVLRFCNVFHQEVRRGCGSDKNNLYLPQPKTVD